jgi:DNA (cytosine-5)-methyltransferase 1
MSNSPTSLELCAGAGGQALGLEAAGFEHVGLFENDEAACNTLRLNKPKWRVEEHDLFQQFDFSDFKGIDLLAGGLPCPPFSVAGHQLGRGDDRNLFDVGVNVADAVRPKAIMFENVKGMLSRSFDDYRAWIEARLSKMGYTTDWRLLNACDFGVPQLRPRLVMVAVRTEFSDRFVWPSGSDVRSTVADTLVDLMKSRGWIGADAWAEGARKIAPTLVGGSKKHGGPDLGPTRARAAWAELGVNGKSIAEEAPDPDFVGMPRLTVRMAARIQGIPDTWGIWGRKTAAYRQVGNAFPPPVAEAVGRQIRTALSSQTKLMKA